MLTRRRRAQSLPDYLNCIVSDASKYRLWHARALTVPSGNGDRDDVTRYIPQRWWRHDILTLSIEMAVQYDHGLGLRYGC